MSGGSAGNVRVHKFPHVGWVVYAKAWFIHSPIFTDYQLSAVQGIWAWGTWAPSCLSPRRGLRHTLLGLASHLFLFLPFLLSPPPHTRRDARGATPAPLGPLVPGAGAGGRPEGLVSALRVRVQTPGHEGSWGPGAPWSSEVARPRSPHPGLAARLPGLTFPGLE